MMNNLPWSNVKSRIIPWIKSCAAMGRQRCTSSTLSQPISNSIVKMIHIPSFQRPKPPMRIEPMTSCLLDRLSNHWAMAATQHSSYGLLWLIAHPRLTLFNLHTNQQVNSQAEYLLSCTYVLAQVTQLQVFQLFLCILKLKLFYW